ncbi:MAG: hypothetical protein APF84_08155 [Gracilibacter sp. BRH_c7a]|nr:MAG: hypothetical protein APF84_08155 [Gracilibacter sp. BRH_c7a]
MRKIGQVHHSLTLLTFIAVLTLGMLMYLPNGLTAAATDELAGASVVPGESAGTTEPATDELAGASAAPGEAAGTSEAAPDELAGASASFEPLEHYEPLPVEPIHQEANNVLLGSGLGVAVLFIGGSIVMDRRKK